MDPDAQLTRVAPQPISSPANTNQPYYYPPPPTAPYSGPPPGVVPSAGVEFQGGPGYQVADPSGSTVDAPRPSQAQHQGQAQSFVNPQNAPPLAIPPPVTIQSMKTSCQFALREYVALQKRRQRVDHNTSAVDVENCLRWQASVLLQDLTALQSEVRGMVKAGENHRWRKWVVGGGLTAFIPAIRKIFRRGSDEESEVSTNDTEYAFRKSKGLLSRIKNSLLGSGGLASIAFFVFAVLYVFQNEVTLRVAKTLQKRIKRLRERIEDGGADVNDKDVKLLDGWRWRVLLW